MLYLHQLCIPEGHSPWCRLSFVESMWKLVHIALVIASTLGVLRNGHATIIYQICCRSCQSILSSKTFPPLSFFPYTFVTFVFSDWCHVLIQFCMCPVHSNLVIVITWSL
jgi:hypothetical protein